MKRLLILAALLVALVPLAFASGGGETSATGTSATAGDFGKRIGGANYWMAKFDQPVTLHVVNFERPQTPFLPGDGTTKNEWTRGIKEFLNIDIVTDWVSDSAGYTAKLNLAIASKELPDVFRCDPIQFTQLVEAGMVADLTDYQANNLSGMVFKIMEAAPVVTASAKFNGRLMGLPTYGYGDLWQIYDLWIRNDWMKQSGLPAPKSIADLEKIMDSFMKANPGSYGMGAEKTLNEVFKSGAAFNAKPRIWVDGPDGSIVYGSVQPEMKAAIAKWAEWYKKGYLRKDFMAIDQRAIVGDIAAGKVGVHFMENWAGWVYVDAVKALGMDAFMAPYEIPTESGKPGIFPIGFDNGAYLVVNKNSKVIPAALKSISFVSWVCMEATSQGILTDAQVDRYLLKGEGRHTMIPIELNDPYGNGPAMVEWAHKVGLNNYQITEPAMTSEWKAQYDQAAPWWRDKSPTGYGRWIQQYYPQSSGWQNLQVIKQGRYVATRLTGAMPAEGAAYGSTLDELLVEGFTKIIVGEQPLSYFDTLVAQWKSSGGDVTTKAVNRAYGKKK